MSERIVSLDVSEIGRELQSFRLKDPKRVSEIEATIRLTGTLPPLLVARIDDRWVLIDGFKRLEAARRADHTHVPASSIESDRAQALALQAQLNSQTNSLCALEEGWIIHELHRGHGQTFQQIGAAFGRDRSWALRREQLVLQLSPDVQTLIRQGELDPAAALELVLLHHRTQEALARRAAQARLSVAQLRMVVRLVLQAPDEPHRRYLVDHPREALQALGMRFVANRDPWSELELLLGLAPGRPTCPDPACRERLIRLCRTFLLFLEGTHETGNDLTGSGALRPESPDPRDCAATQNRA